MHRFMFALAALALSTAGTGECPAAPAPFAAKPKPPAKPAPPPFAGGAYLMTWKGVAADTRFQADGTYNCDWQGETWHGRWRASGGRLHVDEWPAGEPDAVSRWSVTLRRADAPESLAGTLHDGGDTSWRAEPLGGPVF